MKKLAILFTIALLISPFVALAEEIPATVNITCPSGQTWSSSFETCVPNSVNSAVGNEGGDIPSNQLNQSQQAAQQRSSQFVPLTRSSPIPGITDQQPGGDMANFFNNLYMVLIGLAAAAAVVMIIYGGVLYATQDSPGGKSNGKVLIQQALMGLVLVLLPAAVFSIVNPEILSLSVGWKTINIPQPGQQTNAGKYNSGQPTAIAGCKVTPGPVPGSKIFGCSSSSRGTAASNAQQAIATECADSASKAVSSDNCIDPVQKVNDVTGRLETVCTGGSGAIGWCSGPILTVEVVYKGQSLLGFLKNGQEFNNCSNQTKSGWLGYSGWMPLNLPIKQYAKPNIAYQITCPLPSDPLFAEYKKLVEMPGANTQPPACYNVPVTCAYLPS